jgi:hypothetical protein
MVIFLSLTPLKLLWLFNLKCDGNVVWHFVRHPGRERVGLGVDDDGWNGDLGNGFASSTAWRNTKSNTNESATSGKAGGFTMN